MSCIFAVLKFAKLSLVSTTAPAETSSSPPSQGWEQEIRNALMPVAPKTSKDAAVTPTSVEGPAPLYTNMPTPPTVVVSAPSGAPTQPRQDIQIAPEEAVCKDISKLYQMFADDVLGSGQFGIVYGGKNMEAAFLT